MRYLILTDIHGNIDALRKVLEEAEQEGFDDILVLGDLVGYGAGAQEVVDLVRSRVADANIVRGNHDKVVAGLEDGINFNEVALAAALWTRERLTEESLQYVRSLPRGPVDTDSGAVLCHGTPLDEDEYLLSVEQAEMVFARHRAELTLFGHTHLPTLVRHARGEVGMSVMRGAPRELELRPGEQWLFNPGSVGQPRDRDARAAYAILDREAGRLLWRRVEYPVRTAQRRIEEAGLPTVLAYRLSVGV